MGGIEKVSCIYCSTTGQVNESKIEADAKQNYVKSSEVAERKANVDKSTSKDGKDERRKDGKGSSVASSPNHL
jgi:hypothetical protein